MRTRLMYSLAIVFGLAVVADVEATWPRRDMGGGYYYGGTAAMYPTSPTYVSGTVIGGPVYATDMYSTSTVVEQTGPFGLVRRRVIMATPTPVMPAPAIATAATPMPTTGTVITPASGTTVMPMPAMPAVTPTTTVIERTGPFGLFRRRVTVAAPTPIMPAPVIATPAMTITPTPAVIPASGATTAPMPATTTTTGVVTGSYVVPPTGTVTVVPAQYSYSRPFFRRGTYYSTPMPMTNGTTYYAPPGSVTTATYVVPETATGTYYPQYSTGRYFGFSGFGFRWR